MNIKIKFTIFLVLFLSLSLACNANDVLNYPLSAKSVTKILPEFIDTSCKFQQEKIMKTGPNTEVKLQSGGDFKFIKTQGVVFDTTYPVQSSVSYTTEQNKQIGAIVKALSDKNYAYLEKNFDIYFVQNSQNWILALKPLSASKISYQLNLIKIQGDKAINKMEINTVTGKTILTFTGCK